MGTNKTDMETVKQRNKAIEWWWSLTDSHKENLCAKYGYDKSQCVPQLINCNIAYSCFEKETGKTISQL